MSTEPAPRTWPWWTVPLVVGLLLSAAILLFGQFRPHLLTFYSFL